MAVHACFVYLLGLGSNFLEGRGQRGMGCQYEGGGMLPKRDGFHHQRGLSSDLCAVMNFNHTLVKQPLLTDPNKDQVLHIKALMLLRFEVQTLKRDGPSNFHNPHRIPKADFHVAKGFQTFCSPLPHGNCPHFKFLLVRKL